MHRIIILGVAGLAVSGCALPPAIVAISYATDGVLLATTGKTKTDHVLSAGMHQDCSTFRIVQGKEICHDWADGKNPYAEVKDDNSNLAAGNEIGVPIYQATLNNEPFKPRPDPKADPKTDANKIAAANKPAPAAAINVAPAPVVAPPKAAKSDDAKIVTAPVAVVKIDPPGGDVVPVSSSEVSEVIDRAPIAGPGAKKPAAKKAAPQANISKAPAKPAPNMATAPLETHDFVVVLGSFRSEANARRTARLHRDISPAVALADVQGRNFWRVSSGPYSADQANQIAQRLREDGLHDALVVRDTSKGNQAALSMRNGSQLAALR